MQMTGNTVLITGGGSGIGLGLAGAFHALGNTVVIAGRRKALLDEVAASHPGMQTAALDVADGEDIRRVAGELRAAFPALNTVIHCAGIMRPESLASGALKDAEETVAANLLGTIRLTAALLPHLLSQPRATVMTVSSGLAFIPLAITPAYCATKAAIHSYTQSLRYQLRGTKVEVLELIPPYVQTELMGARQAADPAAMPLKDFLAEAMTILKTAPDQVEICVERVKPLRFAASNENYDAFFEQFNHLAAQHH